MPFYDFRCEECNKLVEDEFFKLADEKKIECCGIQMKQVILKAPGLSDPGGIGQKWTNDGYQMREEQSGNIRTVTEKWEKGKNVIRLDVHKDDPQTYGVADPAEKMNEWFKEKYKKDMPKGIHDETGKIGDLPKGHSSSDLAKLKFSKKRK
jgi:hypothetical protein